MVNNEYDLREDGEEQITQLLTTANVVSVPLSMPVEPEHLKVWRLYVIVVISDAGSPLESILYIGITSRPTLLTRFREHLSGSLRGVAGILGSTF
jgi:hypothetical protein